MPRRRKWLESETRLLINNYKIKSIKELMELLPTRSQDSINNRIKYLKANKKIKEEKSQDAINRSYRQRV